MKLRQASWFGLAIALALGAGCGPKEEGGTSESGGGGGGGDKKFTIAMIPKGTTHEFWKSVEAGARDAEKELGNVEVIWKGPLKEDNKDEQVKVVEDFTGQGVDGIALAPLDDTALRIPAENAKKAGVPVLIFDSDLKDVDVVSFVATDNKKGGFMAGEHLAKLIGGKGKVVLLRYQEGSASTTFREEGFLEAMKANPGIELLSDNRYAGATVESALAESENLLSRFKNPDGSPGVDAIFCPNESSTAGMLRALQDGGWAGKVKFVGFDASAKLIEALEAGQLHGLILQNPRRMGYLAVKTMVESLQGKTPEKRIDTGATLVTKENMKEPDVAKLLEIP
ncbi:MAG TPA: substrate-binding domain-containing protein [Fimbriimonadaceae bacterium]|nr:substrate-binding domain-containing protein [Fimbriimonadaceae bacterium]